MIRRPAQLCHELLAALAASDGRRRRRKRDTTPDAIGIAIKRELLERAPPRRTRRPGRSRRGWWSSAGGPAGAAHSAGAVRAMALEVLGEYRLTVRLPAFDAWLVAGAPSEDRSP